MRLRNGKLKMPSQPCSSTSAGALPRRPGSPASWRSVSGPDDLQVREKNSIPAPPQRLLRGPSIHKMPYRFSTQTRRCPPLRNMRPAARCTRVQLHRDTRGTLLVSLRTEPADLCNSCPEVRVRLPPPPATVPPHPL